MEPTQALSYALETITGVHRDCEEGSIEDLARRLDLCDRIKGMVETIESSLSTILCETMSDDFYPVEGVGTLIRQEQAPSTAGSNWGAARNAARQQIIRRVAVDRGTAEIRPDWRDVAEQTWDLIERSLGFGPYLKRAFRLELGLDPDDFITYTARGYTVHLDPRPSEMVIEDA